MPSPEALYNAVKSGSVQLADLNDDGKAALSGFMDQKLGTTQKNDQAQMDEFQHQQPFEYTPPADSQPSSDIVQQPNVLDKIFKDNPISRVLNYPFAKAAENSIPNAPMIGTRPDGSYGNLPGTNARQQYTAENPVLSTGNQTVDKVGDFLGGVGAFFTPIGGPGTGAQNVASDIAGKLGATRLGMQAENALGNLGASAANKINPFLVGQGLQLSPNLASKVTQSAGKGALDFGIANPLYTAATTDPTLQNMGQAALEGVIGGAALGGAFGAAGSGLEKLASKYAGTKIGDALGGFFGKSSPITPETAQPTLALPEGRGIQRINAAADRGNLAPNTEPIYGQGDIYKPEPLGLPESQQYNEIQRIKSQQTLGLPEAQPQTISDFNRRNGNVLPTNNEPIYGKGNIAEPLGLPQGNYVPPTRYKVLNGEDSFNHVAEKVFPAATERMTPPLENPNELAKWVQGHLNDAGHDVSLNDVRRLSYEDMRQLAEEMRGKLNPADVVRKTAHDMGYGKIYDQTAPTIKDRMASDLQNQVYGVYPNKVNISKPTQFNKEVTGQAAAPKQGLSFKREPKLSDANVYTETPQQMQQRHELQMKELSDRQRISELSKPLIGRVAAPETKIGFTKLSDPKLEPIAAKEKVLNADAQPSKLGDLKAQDEVIQTKEPRIRDKIYNALDQAEQAARERLAAKRNTLSSLPIDQYRDYSIIGAAKLGKGTIKFADWSEAMVKDFGQEIKPHLKDIYTMSKNQVKEAEKNVVNKEKFNKVEANPTLPDTSSQIQSKTIKERTSLGQKVNQAYINTVDDVHRLRQYDTTSQKAGGSKLTVDSAYKLALQSRNSDKQSQRILEHKMIDQQGNEIGNSLMDVAKQIPAKDLKAFEDYQVAKHAPTRMERGETVYKNDLNMTIQKAKMISDNYEKSNPEFAKVNQDYQTFDNQLGQNWLVDTGMLKQSQWDQYRHDNPFYTPNNRIMSDLEKNNKFGSKSGYTDQSNNIHQATGSEKPIVSPLESRIEHVSAYVKSANDNAVGQSIVRTLRENPEALKGFAEIVHDEPHINVDEMIKKDGIEGLINHASQTFENAKKNPDLTKGNVVSVLMDGEFVHIRVNDVQMLDAVSNLDKGVQNKVVELAGKVTHVLKTTTTGANPMFGLLKNIWKDIPHAYAASKSINHLNPVDNLKWGYDLAKAFIDVTGNREAYQSYQNMGGGHSSSLSADQNLLAQSKEKLVPSTGLGQTLKRNLLTKPLHKLENFNNVLESAPRLAEYSRIVKQGGDTYNNRLEALHQASDLTVNFSKRGAITKQVDPFIPYLNAAVQGLDQLARMSIKNPVAVGTKAIMAITLPQVVLYSVNHNDPNYQQLSNYVKDNNFCIPVGDGTFLKIPKPRELGMIFGSGVERALRKWNDHDPNAFQDYANNVIQNFAPPGVGGTISGIKDNGISGAPLGALRDTVAGPFINLGLNKDFANRPIVPKDLVGLSPKLQSDPKTSEPAKFIGNLTNSSPKQLDYLAKSYLGGISSLGIPLTTKGNGDNVFTKLGDTLKQQVTADPLYSNDIQSNFYNEKAKQDQAKLDAKATGIPAQRDLSGYYDKLASSISPLRKAEKQIQNDNSLSNSEKQAKLRAIQASLNNVLQRGLVK